MKVAPDRLFPHYILVYLTKSALGVRTPWAAPVTRHVALHYWLGVASLGPCLALMEWLFPLHCPYRTRLSCKPTL